MEDKYRLVVIIDDMLLERLEKMAKETGIGSNGPAARTLIVEGLNRRDRNQGLFPAEKEKGVA